MVPFCPEKEPFQSYARNIRRFAGDLGVTRAVQYYREGVIPDGFKWLRLIETGFVDVTIEPMKKQERPDSKSTNLKRTVSVKPKSPSRPGKRKQQRTKHATKSDASTVALTEHVPLASFQEQKRFELIAHLLPPSLLYTR